MKNFKVFVITVLALLLVGPPVFSQTNGLSKRQVKTLNRKLPPKFRAFFETADSFVIETDTIREEPDAKHVYRPNRKMPVGKKSTRTRILGAFYAAVATGGGGAACWLPNHSIVARKGRRSVRLDICFTCGEFVLTGALGSWKGGLSTAEPLRAEELMNALLEKYGVACN